jgi:hypothetical protein
MRERYLKLLQKQRFTPYRFFYYLCLYTCNKKYGVGGSNMELEVLEKEAWELKKRFLDIIESYRHDLWRYCRMLGLGRRGFSPGDTYESNCIAWANLATIDLKATCFVSPQMYGLIQDSRRWSQKNLMISVFQ